MQTTRRIFLALLALAFTATAHAQARRPISRLPYTITKPGNYYLTANLVLSKPLAVNSTGAITVLASDVTLDLNGRTISTTLPNTSATAIANDGNQSRIRIQNGTITGFGTGIFLFSASTDGPALFAMENLNVSSCTDFGIWLDGAHSSVRRCNIVKIGGGSVANLVTQGLRLDKSYNLVEDRNITTLTRSQNSFTITGIHCSGSSNIIRRNRVADGGGSGAANTIGIRSGGSSLVSDNLVNGWETGLSMSNSAYSGNFATNCATPYLNGQDAGGNK